jgi:hypothetical protein
MFLPVLACRLNFDNMLAYAGQSRSHQDGNAGAHCVDRPSTSVIIPDRGNLERHTQFRH